MINPFQPVGPGGNWHRNAVVDHHSDLAIAMGFDDAARVLVAHWQERGPNDLLFLPIIYNHRHSLEVVLKDAIRECAALLRRDGSEDESLRVNALNKWLASREAGHGLVALATKLDDLLSRLELEGLPTETHDVLLSLHQLDPKGDSFKYSTVYESATKQYKPAPRPGATHVDVVAMSEHFAEAFSLLAGGVMSVLDEVRQAQDDMWSMYDDEF